MHRVYILRFLLLTCSRWEHECGRKTTQTKLNVLNNPTRVVNHVCSREEVLGSNFTTPNFLPNVFAQLLKDVKNALRLGHHTRYFTLFSKVQPVFL